MIEPGKKTPCNSNHECLLSMWIGLTAATDHSCRSVPDCTAVVKLGLTYVRRLRSAAISIAVMSSAIALPPELTSISGAETFVAGPPPTLAGTQLGAQLLGGLAEALPATNNITPANADITKFILAITVYPHTSLLRKKRPSFTHQL